MLDDLQCPIAHTGVSGYLTASIWRFVDSSKLIETASAPGTPALLETGPYEERDCPFVQRLSPPGQVAEPGLMEKCAKHRVQELQCRRFPKPRCPATVPQPPHNVLGAQQDSARGFRGISSCRGAGSVQTDYITTSGRALLVSGPMACRWRPRRADILLGKLTRKQGCGKRFRRQ